MSEKEDGPAVIPTLAKKITSELAKVMLNDLSIALSKSITSQLLAVEAIYRGRYFADVFNLQSTRYLTPLAPHRVCRLTTFFPLLILTMILN